MELALTSPVIQTSNSTTQVDVFQGLVTYDAYIIFAQSYNTLIAVMSILGIVSNIVNVKTFISMGLEDGVTVSFLALSISDLAYIVALLILAIAGGFNLIEATSNYKIIFPAQPYGIANIVANVPILLYVNTVLITTFLAVARCMCVAKPLHFKNAFTKTRSIWILCIFAIYTVFSYFPILYYMGLTERYDPDIDSVRLALYISPKRQLVKDIIWGIKDTGLTFVTQFVVIISVIVMARSLQRASKFRNASTRGNFDNDTTKPSQLSGKDLQVVQQVALISFVYIVCNIPKIITTVASIVEEELTLDKRYTYTYFIIVRLSEFFQLINSSINVFIYYRYNSKFRSCCTLCRNHKGK